MEQLMVRYGIGLGDECDQDDKVAKVSFDYEDTTFYRIINGDWKGFQEEQRADLVAQVVQILETKLAIKVYQGLEDVQISLEVD